MSFVQANSIVIRLSICASTIRKWRLDYHRMLPEMQRAEILSTRGAWYVDRPNDIALVAD